MEKRTDNAMAREDEMLTHAMNIVRESGLASLTMKKIADRMGFTESAAYRYFPNKQALLLRLADEISRALLGPARDIARTSRPPGDRLEHILRHHVDFVLRLDGLPMLLLAEAASSGEEELLERLGSIVEDYLGLVTRVIEEMRPHGGSIQPRDLSLLVFGVPASIALKRRIARDSSQESRVRSLLLPFLVRCLAAEPHEPE